LSATPGAHTVASAVVAMPVLVLHDFIDVVFIVGAQTERTELPLALIINVGAVIMSFSLSTALALTCLHWTCSSLVKLGIQVWKQYFNVSGKLGLTEWVQLVRIDIKVLNP